MSRNAALPDRPDHAGRGAADRKSETQPRSDTRSDGGQYLPLRLLSAHRKRGPPRFDGGLIMNIVSNPNKIRGFERYVKVDNVSRRSILKGLGLAGGFVLAAPVMSPRLCRVQDRCGRDAARYRGGPARVRRDRTGRHCHDRRTPRRDGNRRPHQPADDRCRRDGGRLVARSHPAGAMATRSNSATRIPTDRAARGTI